MDSSLSTSKGCFVFKPEHKKKRDKKVGYEHEAWYPAFKECWQLVEDKIQAIHNTAFSEVLGHIVRYLKLCHADPVFADVVPAVALLTGVSVPDHAALFATVCDKLRQEVTPYIASLHGDECQTIKTAQEKLVSQFVNKDQNLDDTITEHRLKKSKCTFTVLSAWYKSQAVFMPDNKAMSTDVNTSHPLSPKECTRLKNNSFPCTSKRECEKEDSPSTCKHELPNGSNNFPEEIFPRSPRSSAKKFKSPLKQLYTPTKTPRKLMVAKKLLLQSPDTKNLKKQSASELSTLNLGSAERLGKVKRSLGSPCKHEGSTSSLKSPLKVQISSPYKVKTDLSDSFDSVNLIDDSIPSDKIVRHELSPTSPGSSHNRHKSTKKGSGSKQVSPYEIRESVVMLTPLKDGVTLSPSNSSKSECRARRQSCKRPASASPCQSAEVKKRKNGQCSPSSAVRSSRYSGTPRKARVLIYKPPLVVVLPDFESFSPAVLRDLILIASGYVQELPLVFVFGVATTITAVHRSLPHHVSSKICIQVYESRSSLDLFSQVVDEVLLSSDCPFMLGSRTFQLMLDNFLFYDFSVQAFVQRLKFCILEHFLQIKTGLCCPPSQLHNNVAALHKEDLEHLRRFRSFRSYVESRPKMEQGRLLIDDQFFKTELERLLLGLHKHICRFHCALRSLHALTASLPKAPLGRNLRELYATAVSSPVVDSAQYGECMRLLELQSREELEARLESVSSAMGGKQLGDLADQLPRWVEQLRFMADVRPNTTRSPLKSPAKLNFGKHLNRSQLLQKISEMSRKVRPLSAYEELRKQVLVSVMQETLPQYLRPPSLVPFHEVVLFDDMSVKKHLVPSPRAALHTALNNPAHYLQCQCCDLPEPTAILNTMPDTCIAYKLHLESGKLVNLYDWLQAFIAIVSPGDSEESQEVDPHIQARFTQAVSELQFLGFIKASKKKTDHVLRTTWGAC